jgi:hypothetical protein
MMAGVGMRGLTFDMSGKQRRARCSQNCTLPPAVVCPLDGGVRPHWPEDARALARVQCDGDSRAYEAALRARLVAHDEFAAASCGSAHELTNVCSGRRLKRRPLLE